MAERNLFSFTLPELQRWRHGHAVSARHLNQVVDVVDDMRTGIVAPRQVSHPPRGAKKEAGTRTQFCKIVSPQLLEEPEDIDPGTNLVAIRLVTGEGEPIGEWPTLAWTWPARTYGHYKMFEGKSDVFLALYMEGGWYVRWDIRYMPVPVPDGIDIGDCSA